MTEAAARVLAWAALVLGLALGLAGCAGPPVRNTLPPTTWRLAADDTPLGRLASLQHVDAGGSAFRPLLQPTAALQTRLALIDQARIGVDLQTYEIGNDETGHEILRALRDAARRGVRVRVLIDDFHTVGLSDLLLGLAAEPGVELRLYNPFSAGRDSMLLRLAALVGDFSQLNRRMHNKLFVADGRATIFGGRNLTDAYFARNAAGNFVDFELLGVGQVAVDLSRSFDHYWNSVYAVPVQALMHDTLDAPQRRDSFDRLTRPAARSPQFGLPEDTQNAIGDLTSLPLMPADAKVYYDNTEKTGGGVGSKGGGPPLPVGALVRGARTRLVVVSPYFLPSPVGVKLMRDAHERGVAVQVLTNSLVDTDERLVSLAYGQRRHEFLRAGLRLFELSSSQFKQEQKMRYWLGSSVARLHAKLGMIDDHLLLIGSMNIDPRSANTNTELALVIDSAELVHVVQEHFQPSVNRIAHEVRLADNGQDLVWVTVDNQGREHLEPEPEPPAWELLMLWLMSRFVPNDLL